MGVDYTPLFKQKKDEVTPELRANGLSVKDKKAALALAEKIADGSHPFMQQAKEQLRQGEELLREIRGLSPEDKKWFDWFITLSEDQKKLVETCAEHGIRVTPENYRSIVEQISRLGDRNSESS